MSYEQEPPFCIQVELTEGCNLACTFCGINGIRPKAGGPFKFLDLLTADRLASEIARLGWNPRIEFAMHGEPTMHPRFVDVVYAFRKRLPRRVQLMMTSNGAGFLKDVRKIEQLFNAGLNVLALDDYKNVRIVPKVMERVAAEYDPIGPSYRIYNYPEELWASPHKRWPTGSRALIVVMDILEAEKGNHATITNHAGCGGPPTQEKAGQRCAKPFREIGVRWDGNIAGCCNDWRGIYKVGNVNDMDLDVIWQHRRFQAMRAKLYAGERDFGACDGCDYVSYRIGLLPDKKGKVKLPAPTPRDEAVVAAACAGEPYAAPVLRPWEK